MTRDLQKVTVNLVPKAVASLDRLAGATGLSRTDLINRALQVYDFVEAEVSAGNEIRVHRGDGTADVVKVIG